MTREADERSAIAKGVDEQLMMTKDRGDRRRVDGGLGTEGSMSGRRRLRTRESTIGQR